VLGEHPTAFAYLLGALERAVTPPLEVAIVVGGDDAAALRREVFGRLLPAAVAVTALEGGSGGDVTPLLAGRELVDGRATAYVCEHFACQLPVTTPDALRAQLDQALAARRP
jgi:hypothetical protein